MTTIWQCDSCGKTTVIVHKEVTDTKPLRCGACMGSAFTVREAA